MSFNGRLIPHRFLVVLVVLVAKCPNIEIAKLLCVVVCCMLLCVIAKNVRIANVERECVCV